MRIKKEREKQLLCFIAFLFDSPPLSTHTQVFPPLPPQLGAHTPAARVQMLVLQSKKEKKMLLILPFSRFVPLSSFSLLLFCSSSQLEEKERSTQKHYYWKTGLGCLNRGRLADVCLQLLAQLPDTDKKPYLNDRRFIFKKARGREKKKWTFTVASLYAKKSLPLFYSLFCALFIWSPYYSREQAWESLRERVILNKLKPPLHIKPAAIHYLA